MSESHSVISNSLRPYGLYSPWNSRGKNTGVGSFSLLQWIFPTQELNWGLLHCKQILYQLRYQGSPTNGKYPSQWPESYLSQEWACICTSTVQSLTGSSLESLTFVDLARQQLKSSLSYDLHRWGSDHSWAPSKLFILGSYCMISVCLNLYPRNFLLISTPPPISIVVTIQSLTRVQLFETPWIAASRDSLFFSISWSLLPLTSIEMVMPSNRLILCHPLLFLPSVFPNIRIFSNESALHIRWSKY